MKKVFMGNEVHETVRGDKKFNDILNQIIQCKRSFRECGDITQQCLHRGKISISRDYVKRHMKKRTTIILFTEGVGTVEEKRRRRQPLMEITPKGVKPGYVQVIKKFFTGFLLGHIKKIDGHKVFYIDLICSSHRKGRLILNHAEKVAKKMGCAVMGLRAAWRKLIPIYMRLGYKRRANDCLHDKDKRHDRRIKKKLDKDAVDFEGRTMVPGSGDGWWMSKCI